MQPINYAGFFSFENKAGFLFGIFKDRFFIFPPSKRHFSAVKIYRQNEKIYFFCRQRWRQIIFFCHQKKAKNKLKKSVTNTPEIVHIVTLFIFKNYFLFISTYF
jgi:hypothetical protein